MKETRYVVENGKDSGFFLKLDYKDSEPSFSKEMGRFSKYNSATTAQLAIDTLESEGFRLDLHIRKVETSFEVIE